MSQHRIVNVPGDGNYLVPGTEDFSVAVTPSVLTSTHHQRVAEWMRRNKELRPSAVIHSRTTTHYTVGKIKIAAYSEVG